MFGERETSNILTLQLSHTHPYPHTTIGIVYAHIQKGQSGIGTPSTAMSVKKLRNWFYNEISRTDTSMVTQVYTDNKGGVMALEEVHDLLHDDMDPKRTKIFLYLSSDEIDAPNAFDTLGGDFEYYVCWNGRYPNRLNYEYIITNNINSFIEEHFPTYGESEELMETVSTADHHSNTGITLHRSDML